MRRCFARQTADAVAAWLRCVQPLVADFAALVSTLRDQCRPDARPERDVHRR